MSEVRTGDCLNLPIGPIEENILDETVRPEDFFPRANLSWEVNLEELQDALALRGEDWVQNRLGEIVLNKLKSAKVPWNK